MSRLTVSVCMITYKHESFIKQAIEGVLMQQCEFDIELIIADDNSPDNTSDVIEGFRNHVNFNWIKYTKHSANKGMMNNFLWALLNSSGIYIALCEGDDYWTDPSKLQKQVRFLEANQKFMFCFHNTEILNQNNNEKKVRIGNRIIDEIVDLESAIIENNFPTASLLFRNNLDWLNIPDWFLKTTKGDYALIILLAEKGLGKYFHDVMSVYRVHDGGVWSKRTIDYQHNQNVIFYGFIMNYLKSEKLVSVVQRKINYINANYAFALLRYGKLVQGVALFFKSNNWMFSKLRVSVLKLLKVFIISVYSSILKSQNSS